MAITRDAAYKRKESDDAFARLWQEALKEALKEAADTLDSDIKARHRHVPENARYRTKAFRFYVQTTAARQRAKKEGVREHFTCHQWLTLCARYENKCLCCGATDQALTVDHVVPLKQGGVNTIDNIQPLCMSCNAAKSKKTIDYRPTETP